MGQHIMSVEELKPQQISVEQTTAGVDTDPVLAAKRVSKRFRSRTGNQTLALSDVDLEVHAGEFVVLVGHSGCGKTTLLRMFAALETPSRGSVQLGGEPITTPSPDMSFMFQSSVLLPWKTVLQNVLLPATVHRKVTDAVRERALGLLEMAGLANFADHYPAELSGGMSQRVAICRALLTDPSILLMDEPFGALDALTRAEMNRQLHQIWRATRKTVVFVTHDVTEAVRLGTRVVVMSARPGRVNADVPLAFGDTTYEERLASPKYGAMVQLIESKLMATEQTRAGGASASTTGERSEA